MKRRRSTGRAVLSLLLVSLFSLGLASACAGGGSELVVQSVSPALGSTVTNDSITHSLTLKHPLSPTTVLGLAFGPEHTAGMPSKTILFLPRDLTLYQAEGIRWQHDRGVVHLLLPDGRTLYRYTLAPAQ